MTVTSGTVYCDTDYGGTESGTITEPFNTFTEAEGHFAGTCDGACVILLRGATDDTANVTINFDNLTNGMTIKAARSGDWSGVDDGFYGGPDLISGDHYLHLSSGGAHSINISADNVTLDGLQVEKDTDLFISAIVVTSGFGPINVLRCRVRTIDVDGTSIRATGLKSDTITLDSNITVGGKYGMEISADAFFSPTINMYNNTIYGVGTAGIIITNPASTTGATYTLKNSVIGLTSAASGDLVEVFSSTPTHTYDNNASDDGITGETNGIDLSTGTEATDHDAAWTTPGTGRAADFHIEDGDSVLADAGIDIGEATDADDVTRASSFDVGAFDFSVSTIDIDAATTIIVTSSVETSIARNLGGETINVVSSIAQSLVAKGLDASAVNIIGAVSDTLVARSLSASSNNIVSVLSQLANLRGLVASSIDVVVANAQLSIVGQLIIEIDGSLISVSTPSASLALLRALDAAAINTVSSASFLNLIRSLDGAMIDTVQGVAVLTLLREMLAESGVDVPSVADTIVARNLGATAELEVTNRAQLARTVNISVCFENVVISGAQLVTADAQPGAIHVISDLGLWFQNHQDNNLWDLSLNDGVA